MNFDVLDSLDDLSYPHSFKNDEEFDLAVEKGPKSPEFTQLVSWLAKELQALNELESCVNAVTDPNESSSFLVEVSSFLKEMQCPYKSLLIGPISQRLLDHRSRTTLLDYLCTELQTARLLQRKKKSTSTFEIEIDDSSTAVDLGNALNALYVNVDTADNSMAFFSEMESKLKHFIEEKSIEVPPAVLLETLTEEQWDALSALYKDFLAEYTVRREMLLTRLDVTIHSFKWGENSTGKEGKFSSAFLPKRNKLKKAPAVKLSDVIAARESILVVEKTSSANLVKNTKSKIHSVVIPAVPDRGGRPKEQRPPVEMPNWMKRSSNKGGGRGDYRGGGSSRGDWRGKKKFRGRF